VREPAVGQPDLPHGRPLRAGDQPPQDFALDAGRQRGSVVKGIEEREQPADRVEQRPRRVADGNPAGVASMASGRAVAAGAVSSSSAAILSGRSSSTKARNGSSALACAMCPITGSSTDTMRNCPAP
jgi:hypothetical protein